MPSTESTEQLALRHRQNQALAKDLRRLLHLAETDSINGIALTVHYVQTSPNKLPVHNRDFLWNAGCLAPETLLGSLHILQATVTNAMVLNEASVEVTQ